MTAAVVVLSSVVVHAAIMVSVPAPTEWARGERTAVASTADPALAARHRDPSCDADVALAGAASLMWCLTPFAGDRCQADTLEAVALGNIMCGGIVDNIEDREQTTKLALMTAEQIDDIEAELLMPLLDPLEQLAFEEKQEQLQQEKIEQAETKHNQRPLNAQIVEITKPNQETTPDHARFVSEYDSAVEKETVARGSTEEMVDRPAPRDLPATDTMKQPDAPSEIAERPPGVDPAAADEPGQLSMRRPGPIAPAEIARDESEAGDLDGSNALATSTGSSAKKGDGATSQDRRDASEGTQGEGGGGGGSPPIPDLRPTEELLERAVGGGSVDKLDGVEEGENTGLNTVRWKHASFFNRVKRMVAQNWEPWKVYQTRDPSGNVYGHKTKVTRVQVTMKPSGVLAKIYVVDGSGVDFLDDEAVRAFQAAGPFPNPPMALVDSATNLITFQFSFHVEIGKDNGWKIFRHR